jgi:nucleoporin NDC1
VSALIVYILRISQYHVGQRNTESGMETFNKYAFTGRTVMTIGSYVLSAFLFGEIYIWTQPESKKLGYTDQGKNYERLRLNERPMFLRYMFIVLALVQSGAHLWRDYDKIDFPAITPKAEQDAAATAPAPKPRQVLVQKLSSLAQIAAIWSGAVAIVGSLVYIIGFRYVMWPSYYSWARNVLMISLSKSRPLPATLPPFAPLVGMFFAEGTLMLFMWQVINTTFDLFMSQPPLKNGKPITNDSKDPNGSLLKGLKAKKETIKAVALWELALITESIPERRKTLYGEMNRKNGTTLKQVVDICLSEVSLLIRRLNTGLDPHYRPSDEAGDKNQTQSVSLVPQIVQPPENARITGPGLPPATTSGKLGEVAGGFARSLSSPQNGIKTREYLKKGTAEVSQQLQKGVEEVEARSSGFYQQFMASPLGYPLRRSLRRTVNVVVTGAPYSRISILCNAVVALTNLTVSSILEDEYGRMQDEVSQIIRVFTEALKKLDEYIARSNIHWTDYETLSRPEAERKKVAEAEQVREALRAGLEKILRSFGEYLTGLKMSRLEITEAKKVASNGPEMAVVR